MSDPKAVPPGWYPDQNAPGHERWWDGTQWTGHAQAPYAAAAPLKAPAGTNTNTVWIWLVVLLPLLSFASLFFIDFEGYMRGVLGNPGSVGAILSLYTSPATLVFVLGGWVLIALGIVFSLLDWRALKARGIPQPFHWAFAFFALAGYGIVYPIGRSIVVKRRTGGGLAPLWVTIAVFVVGMVVTLIWALLLTQSILTRIPQYLY